MPEPLLKVEDLVLRYGPSYALNHVSMTVEAGTITAVIGANGAGKSTLMKTLAGLLRPQAGRIWFRGQDITGLPAHQRVARGLAVVPERHRLFDQLSVRENLYLGAFRRVPAGSREDRLQQVLAWFPALRGRLQQPVRSLSGGERQMLAVARALMSGPQLLGLDEPTLGLMPRMVEQIFQLFLDLRQQFSLTLVIAEQNVAKALEVADYVYILQNGRFVESGPAAQMADLETVRRAYLGL